MHHFRGKSPKTTVMWQNVAISEISSELMEKTFFGKTRDTGQMLTKTVLCLKTKYIQLLLFSCFEVFSLEIDKKTLISYQKETIS